MKFKKLGALILGAILTIGVAAGLGSKVENDKVVAADTTITFNLGADGTASHSDGSSKTTYSETVNGYTLSITGGTSMYTGARDAKGNSCIKLGTSSKVGGFSFTVPNDVTSAIIYAGKYKTNTTKMTVNNTSYTLTNASNNGAYDELTVDTSSTKTVTLTTVSGGVRAMINTIIWTIGANSSTTTEATGITLTPTSTEVTSGESINITATLTGGSGEFEKTIKWTSSNTDIIANPSDSEDGDTITVKPNDVQTQTKVELTATVDMQDGATASIDITVNPKPADPEPGEPDPEEPGDVNISSTPAAVFELGENGTGIKENSTATTNYTEDSGAYTLTLENCSRVYDKCVDEGGNGCLKLGSSSAVGYFEFTVPEDVLLVKIDVTGRTSKTVGIKINNGDEINITTTSESKEYTTLEIDTSKNKTIKFSTTSNGFRAFVNKVEYYIATLNDDVYAQEIVGFKTKPDFIYLDKEIDLSKFQLNILYTDGETRPSAATSIEIPNKIVGEEIPAIAYFGQLSFNFTIEIRTDSIKSLSWEQRGNSVEGYVGDALKDISSCSNWVFTVTYESGETTHPEFGTGDENVHISICSTISTTPTEEGKLVTADYIFTKEDCNGAALWASYKGFFNTASLHLTITEKLNSITSTDGEQSSSATWTKSQSTAVTSGTEVDVDINDYIHMKGAKGSASTTFRFWTDGIRSYAGNTLTFTAKNGVKITKITLPQVTGTAPSGVSYSNNVYEVQSNEGLESITITGLSKATIDKEIVVEYKYSGSKEFANTNIKAQKAVVDFANFFNETMRAEDVCGTGDNVDYYSEAFATAWNLVAEKYTEIFEKLIEDDKAHALYMLVNATPYWTNEFADADALQQAMRTYDKVVAINSELAKFIEGRPKVEDNGVGIKALIDDNASTIALIVIIALFSSFAFLFVSKRKQRKIEL